MSEVQVFEFVEIWSCVPLCSRGWILMEGEAWN